MSFAVPRIQNQDLPPRAMSEMTIDAARGAVLAPGEQEMVVLPRHGKPPLRFKGRRFTHHWARLSKDTLIIVELWHQLSKGLVISYSILSDGSVGRKSIQVSNFTEATDCLENVCANLDASIIKMTGFDGLWLNFHLHLCFRQKFNLLVSDVLSDWHVLPKLQEHA